MLENKQKSGSGISAAGVAILNAFKQANSLQGKLLVLALALALIAGTACVSWAWLFSGTGAITTGFSTGLIKIEAAGLEGEHATEVMADETAVAGEQLIPGDLIFTNSSTRTVVVRIEASTRSRLHLMDYNNINAAPSCISQDMEYLSFSAGTTPPPLNTAAQIRQALTAAGLGAYLYEVQTSSGSSLYIQTSNLPNTLQNSNQIIAKKIYYGSRHFQSISDEVSASAPRANLTQFVRAATGDLNWQPEFDPSSNGMVINIPEDSGLRAYMPAGAPYYYIALDNPGEIRVNGSVITIPEGLGSGYGANENNIDDAPESARLNEQRARFSLLFRADAVQGTTDAIVEVFGLPGNIASALVGS